MSGVGAVEKLLSAVEKLPAEPWAAFGAAVYSGHEVVAVCPGPRGEETARALAQLPGILRVLSTAYPAVMAERLADLEEALGAITKRCDCC